jgi:hypothetical protein
VEGPKLKYLLWFFIFITLAILWLNLACAHSGRPPLTDEENCAWGTADDPMACPVFPLESKVTPWKKKVNNVK